MYIGTEMTDKGMIKRYADMNGIYDNVYELVKIEKGFISELVPTNPKELINVHLRDYYIQDNNNNYLIYEYTPKYHSISNIKTVVSYYYVFVKTVNHKIDIELPQ